jgi:hypothetical protein
VLRGFFTPFACVLLLSNIVAKVVCNFLIVCNSSCDKLKEREEDVETMCQLNLKKFKLRFVHLIVANGIQKTHYHKITEENCIYMFVKIV